MSARSRHLGLFVALVAAGACLAPSLVAAETIEQLQQPNRVPPFESFLSLGNGVEPGATGTYGFTLRNHYNASLANVTLSVEIYKWATAQEERPIAQIPAPPTFASTGSLSQTFTVSALAPNGSFPIRAAVHAQPTTTEGVYFMRHLLEFDYANVTVVGDPTPTTQHFVMKSRGHFTAEVYESFNYSDYMSSLETLNVSGVIPDSSFSVRAPPALWPLAVVVGATALTGALSLLSFIADAYPQKYPRVKRQMLRLSGKLRVWRVLLAHTVRSRLGR